MMYSWLEQMGLQCHNLEHSNGVGIKSATFLLLDIQQSPERQYYIFFGRILLGFYFFLMKNVTDDNLAKQMT